MHLFFADDSRQNSPSRAGMGPLLATGGIRIDANKAKSLERRLDETCTKFGFPPKEEFKWSPGRELWMRDNLVGEDREAFFRCIIEEAAVHEVTAFVVVTDTSCQTATGADNHEEDVTCLFLERVQNQAKRLADDGIIIVDRPSGDRNQETDFLRTCLETLQSGTTYVQFDNIAFNVVSSPSSLLRLLQLADFVTSCSLSRISGEDRYSPPIFDELRRLFDSSMGRIGGVGVKIHPDYKYENLYHWLLGDRVFVKMNNGVRLPHKFRDYFENEWSP